MNFLKGKRTYLVALGISVVTGAHYLGWVNDSLFQAIMGVLVGGGLAALRASKPA